jgi:hypothetical protein
VRWAFALSLGGDALPDGAICGRDESGMPEKCPHTSSHRSCGNARDIARGSSVRCPWSAIWMCESSWNHSRRTSMSGSIGKKERLMVE